MTSFEQEQKIFIKTRVRANEIDERSHDNNGYYYVHVQLLPSTYFSKNSIT